MRCEPYELSRTSNLKSLPGWDGSSEHPLTELVTGQADEAMWRVIELSSSSEAPFVAQIRWGLAGISGGKALVTVSRDARIAVYATYVQVLAYNLDSNDNDVSVRIGDSDSFVQTHNVFVVTDDFKVDDESHTVTPPRFGKRVHFDCSDASQLGAITLTFQNGQGDTTKTTTANNMPEQGVPLGGIDAINVSIDPVAVVNWRLVFDLSL